MTDHHSTKPVLIPALALALTIGALAAAGPARAQSAVSEGQKLAFDRGQSAGKEIAAGRKAYAHVARGRVSLNGIALGEGDGAKIADESQLKFAAAEDSEVLLFDLP